MKQVNELNKEAEDEITNALVDDIDKFEHTIIEKWKSILYVIIAIVVVISGIAISVNMNNEKNKEIASAFGDAKTAEEINKVIAEYPTSNAVAPVRVKVAKLALDKKDYASAINEYNEILKLNIQSDLRESTQINIALVNELNNNNDEAISQFSKIAKNSTFSQSTKDEANYALGRLYIIKKQNDDAKSALEKVAKSENSQLKEQANALLGRL